MKKRLEQIKHALVDYWRQRTQDPVNKKMSRGALFISRVIPWARGEYWRKNHPHTPPKKHDKK